MTKYTLEELIKIDKEEDKAIEVNDKLIEKLNKIILKERKRELLIMRLGVIGVLTLSIISLYKVYNILSRMGLDSLQKYFLLFALVGSIIFVSQIRYIITFIFGRGEASWTYL